MLDLDSLLGRGNIVYIALAALRADLNREFHAAVRNWELSVEVGTLLKGLTAEHIQTLANRCDAVHVVRMAKGHDLEFWRGALRQTASGGNAGQMDLRALSGIFLDEPRLTRSGVEYLSLLALRSDLRANFHLGLIKWDVSVSVGELFAALAPEQIRTFAGDTDSFGVLRVVKAQNVNFWRDLLRSMENADKAGIDLALVSSLFLDPSQVAPMAEHA